MSGLPISPTEHNGGLEKLLFQLRQTQNVSQPQAQSHAHHSSIASSLPTPPTFNEGPYQPSAITSLSGDVPLSAGGARPSTERSASANLLDLLKFNRPELISQTNSSTINSSQIAQEQSQSPSSNRQSDLLATLLNTSKENKPSAQTPQQAQSQLSSLNAGATSSGTDNTSPSSDTKNYLLQLLSRPKPAQTNPAPPKEPSKDYTPPSRSSSAGNLDLTKSLEQAALEKDSNLQNGQTQATPKNKHGIFTYVNPFEQLVALSPRNRTPKPSSSSQSTPLPSSIQILKPPRHTISESGELKRKVDDRTPGSSPRPSKIKADSAAQCSQPSSDERGRMDDLQGSSSPSQGTGIGKGTDEAIVAGSLETGEMKHKQADEADVQDKETEGQINIVQELRDMINTKAETEFKPTPQSAAMPAEKVLAKEENDVSKCSFPEKSSDAVKEVVDEAAQSHVASNWETADTEDSETKERPVHDVRVYNFPVKPWLSISIRKDASPDRATLQEDQAAHVTKLRKEFDQIDRNLVTSSHKYVIYSTRNEGVRIISQCSATDIKIFADAHDRIFNLSLSTSQNGDTETVICTGISGTVYWASTQGMDRVDEPFRASDTVWFALPPIRGAGEDVSGGVLKTRARASSDHPEFFAVGRGKYIYIVWPSVILNQGFLKEGPARTIDVEKYLSRRSLKVNTGKAGKDFAFSQDDTVIASLDKAGRVKFWDVRALTCTDINEESGLPVLQSIEPKEINEPMMALVTTPANEKSWPTSVMFVDKIRPYQKGGPQRYLIVGMKQNHTLQLWDLALGKPVSEIHLPHEKESDAVCSVSFHPPTGMIIIGHPTRNSIYLLHLSIPKYSSSTPAVSQAEFIEKLVSKDKTLKEPVCTAVLSGIREYTLDNQGELRSLALMQYLFTAQPENTTIFELYAMYSRSLSCITFGQGDLGWDEDNKVISSVDAVEEGLITTEPIKPLPEVESPSISPGARSVVPRVMSKETSSKESGRKMIPSNWRPDVNRTSQSLSSFRAEQKTESALAPGYNGEAESSPEKPEKRRKKKAQATPVRGNIESYSASASASADLHPLQTTHSHPVPLKSDIVNQVHLKNVANDSDVPGLNGPPFRGNTHEHIDDLIKNMEGKLSSEMSHLFTNSLDSLYKRLEKEKIVDAAVSEARQEALLRLVSSTLTDNVEKSLAEIVNSKIEQSVLPVVSSVASNSLHYKLGEVLKTLLQTELQKVFQGTLHGTIHGSIRDLVRNSLPPLVAKTLADIHSNILPTALPEAISRVLRNQDVSREIAKAVADGATGSIQGLVDTVKFRVEEQFNIVLQKDIVPSFTGLAAKTIERVSIDVQRQAMETLTILDHERRADNAKIDQLTKLVAGLTETVSTMAAAQQEFQEKILSIVHQGSQEHRSRVDSQSRPSEVDATSTLSGQPSQTFGKTEEQLIIDGLMDNITKAMNEGNYGDAIMTWLQSGHEQEIFDAYFSKFDPSFVREVNPLILLSLCSLVSTHFEGNLLHERLSWLEVLLQALYVSTNNLESEIREITPKIMGTTVTRLEHLFMRVSNSSAHDPILKRISQLVSNTNRILEAMRGSSHTPLSSYGGNGGNSRSTSQSTVHVR